MNRKVKDIDNLNQEFQEVSDRSHVLKDRFIALGHDYRFYMSTSFDEDRFYRLRDDIFHRLYGIRFHIRILLSHLGNVQEDYETLFKKAKREKWETPFIQSIEVNRLIESSTHQASSLFDSIIYHLTTVFDYLASMLNYVFNIIGARDQYLKWTQLMKSVRDQKNTRVSKKLGEVLNNLNKDFVDKLYEHRSYLIHKKSDIASITVVLQNLEPSMSLNIMSTSTFCKNFPELKSMYKTDNLTLRYVLFWLLNQTYDVIREILFSVKEDIEILGDHPVSRENSSKAFIVGNIDDDGNFVSPSHNYWHIDSKL